MTTLIHQYNNLDTNIQLVFGGYPKLALRDQIVKNYSFEELDAYFDQMLEFLKQGKYNYNPEFLMIDH